PRSLGGPRAGRAALSRRRRRGGLGSHLHRPAVPGAQAQPRPRDPGAGRTSPRHFRPPPAARAAPAARQQHRPAPLLAGRPAPRPPHSGGARERLSAATEPPSRAVVELSLVFLARAHGRYRAALRQLHSVLELADGRFPLEAAMARWGLVELYLDLNRFEEAQP